MNCPAAKFKLNYKSFVNLRHKDIELWMAKHQFTFSLFFFIFNFAGSRSEKLSRSYKYEY